MRGTAVPYQATRLAKDLALLTMNLLACLLITLGFWLVGLVIQKVARLIGRRLRLNPSVTSACCRAINLGSILLGAKVGLDLTRVGVANILVTGVLIVFGFWVVGLVTQELVRRLGERNNLDPDLINLMRQTVGTGLILVGITVALGTVGINVSALVAGLGLTGFALGFAFKDVLSNLLSGVLVLMYRPFRRGDWIVVSGLEGTVVQIDLRYTTLDTTDNQILIPNSTLFTNPITVRKAGTSL